MACAAVPDVPDDAPPGAIGDSGGRRLFWGGDPRGGRSPPLGKPHEEDMSASEMSDKCVACMLLSAVVWTSYRVRSW